MSRIRPLSPPSLSGNSSVVEHRLAKARVEGSNPFSRSNFSVRFGFELSIVGSRREYSRLAGLARSLGDGVNVAIRSGVRKEGETGGLFACARKLS